MWEQGKTGIKAHRKNDKNNNEKKEKNIYTRIRIFHYMRHTDQMVYTWYREREKKPK